MPSAKISQAKADKILAQSIAQLQTSRQNKRARMAAIKESEDLYLGIVEKALRNPFNECFPYMAGYVDHLKAKVDDDSNLLFVHTAEADMKKVQRINAMYERVSKSPAPEDSWEVKHRYAKTNAVFSGVAIYHYFADKNPEYKSHLSVISHYDFHSEPRGGGQIENHLFCGHEGVFLTPQELKDTAYDQDQVKKLVTHHEKNGWKDSIAYESDRNSRAVALGQQPETNNYVGQQVIKFVPWCTTYEGVRYYMLFNEAANVWVRCQLLTELFPDNLWPYITWHTNEDPDVFWSKAPCDDAKPIAKIINTFINQELYNRQKRNYGQRAYDARAFPNVAALADWRPDGLVPVDMTASGDKPLSSLVHEFQVGDLNGSLEMLSWLENFTGKWMGNTPSSQGQSESDKKATVFVGEVRQVEQLIGIKNKSFRNALSRLGLQFKQGLEHNLTKPVAVKIMGGTGVEWEELTKDDLKTESELTVQPVGGTSEMELKRLRDSEKAEVLPTLLAVNPQWKERQTLLLKGFTEEEVKDAFSQESFAEKELLSEAAQAEKDIVEGKAVKLNRGATASFMQHIVDFATNTDDLDDAIYAALMEFALAHQDIVIDNMNRDVKQMLAQRARIRLSTPTSGDAGGMMDGYVDGGAAANSPVAPREVSRGGFGGAPRPNGGRPLPPG
jgi:hypothetical protein